VLGQRPPRVGRRDAGRDAQRDPGTGAGRHRRRGTDDGRAVDAEDGDGRPGPQPVRDGARAGERDAVQDPRVAAELLLVVPGALPGAVGRQAVDAGGAGVRIAQRGQQLDQRGEGVGRRSAEHAGVDLTCQGAHGDDDVDHAAQRGGGGAQADGRVAGVADQQGVRGELLGVLGDVPLQAAGALLLRALGDEPQADGDVTAQCAQCGQVHHDVALAVRGAAAVPAAVALGEGERRGGPGVVVQRRLDVVVAVQQDGGGAGRGRAVADHRVAAVRGAGQADVLEAGVGDRVGDPPGRPAALLRRVLPGVGHRRDGDEFGQVALGARHEGGHAGREVVVRGAGVGGTGVCGHEGLTVRPVLRSLILSWTLWRVSGQ
jgi:hypothetical protein